MVPNLTVMSPKGMRFKLFNDVKIKGNRYELDPAESLRMNAEIIDVCHNILPELRKFSTMSFKESETES